MSLFSISDVDEEGTSVALLGRVRLRSTGSTDSTDELCRVDSHERKVKTFKLILLFHFSSKAM